VIEDIGDCFFEIEDSITNIIVSFLFWRIPAELCDFHCKLAIVVPVKFSGIAIPNPSATSDDKTMR
jgi:hypothetical protein